ncbi:MAG: hypothetical protein SNJ52_01045 [Verrucomicrobiia bacterium]
MEGSPHDWWPMGPSTSPSARLVLALALFCWVSQPIVAEQSPSGWQEIPGARRVESSHNDGDSVAVRVGNEVTIFRLYFVDTLETNPRSEARLTEQARLFGIPPSQLKAAREIAARASQRTRQLTSRPFTVHTKWQRVDPHSSNPSIRAFIETEEGDLGQILVSEGLALIKSGPALSDHPGGRSVAQQLIDLRKQERSARLSNQGAWGVLQKTTPKPSPLDELAARLKQQEEGPQEEASQNLVFAPSDLDALIEQIGNIATVRGRLQNIGALADERIVFLNFEGVPRGGFCGIARGIDLPRLRGKLGVGFPFSLEGEEVELTGLVTEYRGIPQIEITEAEQVKLVGAEAR